MASGAQVEMVVVYTGGKGAYSLRVGNIIVGRDDFLGIDDEIEPDEPEGILGLMVHNGADRGKATQFLREFKKLWELRKAAGSLLQQSGVFNP